MKEHGVRIVVEGKGFRLTVHNATMDWQRDLFLAMEEGQPMTLEQWAHMVPASIKEGYVAFRAVMYPDAQDCFYTLEDLTKKEGLVKKLAPRMATERTPDTVLRPVVALDIDGTLGNWHSDFLEFAWRWLYGRTKLPAEHWFMYDGVPLHHHMNITKEQYRAVKLAYRQSGLKRDMQAFPGAYDLINAVREAGAEVWVCTTRPYLRLDNIDPDTREWLERNQLEVDGVIYGERKYRDLCELVGHERVVGVLDDLPEMVWQARDQELTAALIQRHHNADWWKGLPSLPGLPAAQEWFLAGIAEWKARHDVI